MPTTVVLLFRREVQRVEFIKVSVTVRRAYDGPCCSSVAKFRELFPRTQISEFKCFGTETLDGPSCDPSTQSVFITVILLLETTKQVVTIGVWVNEPYVM